MRRATLDDKVETAYAGRVSEGRAEQQGEARADGTQTELLGHLLHCFSDFG